MLEPYEGKLSRTVLRRERASNRSFLFDRLKKNRSVNPDNKKNVPLETVDIPPEGRVVHLKAYGFVKVFRIVSKD
ncbi:MAG: hypothetical protein E4G94_09230, partial [ANME-2 cluster archaeon]